MTREDRLQGGLAVAMLLGALGLFAPDSWHAFLFAAVLVVGVLFLYVETD